MPPSRPVKLVAFGGGTGLPVLLRGLRDRSDAEVTAIVTVADDGGSSGRLRRELAVPPPGDVRNCLISLAEDRELARLFAHRFPGEGALGGHALGNLILAAIASTAEDFDDAVVHACRLLRTRGVVHPAATEALTLVTQAGDGKVRWGEACTAERSGTLVRVDAMDPIGAAPAAALEAIAAADAVVLGPGSLFTSTIAALLGRGTREALARFAGPVVHVSNLAPQRGETEGLSVADHVRAIVRHAGPHVTDVLVPAEPTGVPVDEPALRRLGVAVHRVPGLVGRRRDGTPGHAPGPLADAVLAVVAGGQALSAMAG